MRHRRCRTIPSSARDIKAPNKWKSPSQQTRAFLFIVILAVDYLESSTVKPGFRTANNFTVLWLNAPNSARDIKAPKKWICPN